jgi:hypothetical protein
VEKLVELRDALEAASKAAEKPEAGPEAFDLKKIICFAIPIFNLIGSMYGLPPLPIPAFCNT